MSGASQRRAGARQQRAQRLDERVRAVGGLARAQRRRDHGPPLGREDTVRAQLGAAEIPPPAAGGALATAMLVGRMLLLDNSNDRAEMLDVGNVIMIMHG